MLERGRFQPGQGALATNSILSPNLATGFGWSDSDTSGRTEPREDDQIDQGPAVFAVERRRTLDELRWTAGTGSEGAAENRSWVNRSARLILQRGFRSRRPVCRDLILIKELADGAIVIRADGEGVFRRRWCMRVAGTATGRLRLSVKALSALSGWVKTQEMRVMQRGTEVQ